MHTPWGASQSSTHHGLGVVFYSTAGHGGFRVSPKLNATMPEALRLESGWYEEDCDWARVVLAFPSRFPEKDLDAALATLRNWSPDDYEKWTRKIVMPGEPLKRDEDIFRMETRGRMVTLAAAGSGPGRSMAFPGGDVQEGYVEVFAGRGGRQANGMYPKETAYYLVPDDEYESGDQSFVIDEQRHELIRRGN